MSKPSALDTFLEKSARPACPDCKGTGKVELEKGIDIVFIPCKLCGGYGYLLARGNYVTFEKVQEILEKEPKEMYRLFIKLVWYLGLKSGEAIKVKPGEINIPTDKAKLEKHARNGEINSLRVWRTPTRARVLPLPEWLKNEILTYAKNKGIKDDEPIFKRNRTTIFQRLSSYGSAIGGNKKIGTDAIRKGFGIWYLAEGGRLEDLQEIFGHNQMNQTVVYLGIDGRTALKNFIKFQEQHSPYGDETSYMNEQFERMKLKLMEILGTDKCIRCGEKELTVLDFDHIAGGGKKEITKFGSNTQMIAFYTHNPELARKRLQVLCANCNRRKKRENSEFERFW